jgi:glutamine synthetase
MTSSTLSSSSAGASSPGPAPQPVAVVPLRWVKLTFVDVFGTNCALTLPADGLDGATTTGILFDGSSLEGPARYLESDMRLLADRATLIDHGNGDGRVVCSVLTPAGSAWGGDPRTGLAQAVAATDELSVGFTAGAELEFYLLDAEGEPIDQAGYFDDRAGAGVAVVKAAADELVAAGVPVASAHHEGGPGQFELDLGPLDAMGLADALVTAKEAVRRLAEGAGLVATFMAQPLSGCPGSGLHLHQRAGDVLLDDSGTLTEEGRMFTAGQLAHASGLCALAAPTVNSYRRLHAGPEAPSAAIWSTANRAALIRVSTTTGANASVEYRGSDPMANPYLLLAGLLVTGAAGIAAESELGHPNDEVAGSFDPSLAQRFEPLPRNLDEALDALVADDVLTDAFDPALISNLVTGRRAELEQFRTHVTSWERDRYLDC